jgi:dihydrofolate reductase
MQLITIHNVSVDGYTEDRDGRFDFTEPQDDVFAFITDLIRPIETHLYGRRMYETMAVWETEPAFAAESELMAEFARVWQSADKVVYSTTLEAPLTARTRIERTFDPESVRALKASATTDLSVAGPNLAAQAFAAGLVDECHLFVAPVFVGRGKPALPADGRGELALLDEHRFDSGVVYLRYGVRI